MLKVFSGILKDFADNLHYRRNKGGDKMAKGNKGKKPVKK